MSWLCILSPGQRSWGGGGRDRCVCVADGRLSAGSGSQTALEGTASSPPPQLSDRKYLPPTNAGKPDVLGGERRLTGGMAGGRRSDPLGSRGAVCHLT